MYAIRSYYGIPSPLPVSGNFPGMSAVGSTVWLSGENGVVLRSTDRGATWQQQSTGSDVMIDAISFADPRNGWASSIQRKVFRTNDGGETWVESKTETFLPITTICARSAEECWIASYNFV